MVDVITLALLYLGIDCSIDYNCLSAYKQNTVIVYVCKHIDNRVNTLHPKSKLNLNGVILEVVDTGSCKVV